MLCAQKLGFELRFDATTHIFSLCENMRSFASTRTQDAILALAIRHSSVSQIQADTPNVSKHPKPQALADLTP